MPQVIQRIVDQHADEASALWQSRRLAVHAPHYRLRDLAKLDSRLDANLDGLVVAGDAGWQACREGLKWKEPGEVFIAGVVALNADRDDWMQEVLEVAGESEDLARGLISSMGWLEWPRISRWAEQLRKSGDPMMRLIGLGSAAVHRRVPVELLEAGLNDADETVRFRALKSAGEMRCRGIESMVRHCSASGNNAVRAWAAWAGSLLGDPAAVVELRSILTAGVDNANYLCELAMRAAPLEDSLPWQRDLAATSGNLRLAIIGAGAMGCPRLIPWLLHQMANPTTARLAGEAFSMITGADFADDDLSAAPPDGIVEMPSEAADDDDVAMDPDEDLPWPDQALVEEWWIKNSERFSPGSRYLLGGAISVDRLEFVLREGRQRQRSAAALELAISQNGRPLFNVKAPGFRQRRELSGCLQ